MDPRLTPEKIDIEGNQFSQLQKIVGFNCLLNMNDLFINTEEFIERVATVKLPCLIGLYLPNQLAHFNLLGLFEIVYDKTFDRCEFAANL